MFGVTKKVERVRAAIVGGLNRRAAELHAEYRKTPADPLLVRAMVLLDISDVIRTITVDPEPDE